MLSPESFIVWFVAFYFVLVTRDLSATLIQLGFFFGTFFSLLQSDDPSPDDIFIFSVRRPAFGLYGALAGYAIVSVLECRVLIPVHSFSNTRTHLAGSIVAVAPCWATYSFITALGLVRARDSLADAEVGIFFTVFGILAFSFLLVLLLSWLNIASVFRLQYQDMATRTDAKLPLSRLPAEAIALSVLLLSPSGLWINLHAWPQWGAGLLTIGLTLSGFVLLYWALNTRHAMNRVHYDSPNVRISWGGFVLLLASMYAVTSIVWLLVAQFSSSLLVAEITLLSFTAFSFLVAIVLSLTPNEVLRRPVSTVPEVDVSIQLRHTWMETYADDSFEALQQRMSESYGGTGSR